jgi:hypothetical protein
MVFANGGRKVILMGEETANVSCCSDNYNHIVRQRKLLHVHGQKNLRDEKREKSKSYCRTFHEWNA